MTRDHCEHIGIEQVLLGYSVTICAVCKRCIQIKRSISVFIFPAVLIWRTFASPWVFWDPQSTDLAVCVSMAFHKAKFAIGNTVSVITAVDGGLLKGKSKTLLKSVTFEENTLEMHERTISLRSLFFPLTLSGQIMWSQTSYRAHLTLTKRSPNSIYCVSVNQNNKN